MGRYSDTRQFEDEVRKVADSLFRLEPGECKSQVFNVDNSKKIEIDGVASTKDLIHLIMVTTSTRLDKVASDVKKLNTVENKIRKNDILVKKWIILQKEPEGPHSAHAKEHGVTILSFSDFKGRLFDGKKYLSLRKDSSFGSARNPINNSHKISDDEYVEPLFTMDNGKRIPLEQIVQRMVSGECIILIGQFGTGKSLTLKEIWLRLRKKFLRNQHSSSPIALNLREHWGARYADEILWRHARSIGFEPESSIIGAWRAGTVDILVDGFDEVATQSVSSADNIQLFKDMRRNSLRSVRELVKNTPHSSGILITRRDNYFDDYRELEDALGIKGRKYKIIRIEEFDEDRTVKFCLKKGINFELPPWIPRKALFLGYLVKENLLNEILQIDGSQGQARAWNELLKLVSARDAELDDAPIDADTVQKLLEYLSIKLRMTPKGDGPISHSMLFQAFTTITGRVPADTIIGHLQRLPGLTERDLDPGLRSFVDPEYLEALQGSCISRWLLEGTISSEKKITINGIVEDVNWLEGLGQLACSVAVDNLRSNGWLPIHLKTMLKTFGENQLGADLFCICLIWHVEDDLPFDLGHIELSGAHIGLIDTEEVTIRNLTIKDSIIKNIVIGINGEESEIEIFDSHITEIDGATSYQDLPENIKLSKCNEDIIFQNFGTTNAIMNSNIENQKKALLSALKKLFRQKGSGRVEGAFRKGVTTKVDIYIETVLKLLVNEGFAWKLKKTYHPIRAKAARAHNILDNPHLSNDALVEKILKM